MELIVKLKDQATRQLNTIGGKFKSIGTKVTALAKKFTMLAGVAGIAAVGLAAKNAISTFTDFEKAIANAASVTGATGEVFEATKAHIEAVSRELGETTVFSASQAANAFYDLASAGYDVANMTKGELKPIMDLAAATQTDLTKTTEVVTSTLGQFGLGMKSSSRIADVFAKTIGSSKATVEALEYSLKYVGPVAKSMGMEIEEVNAILGNLYNAGFKGEQAGTALRGAFSRLLNPTAAMVTQLETMGLTLEDVDPTTRDFADILDTLKDAGIDTAGAMKLFGVEAAPAMLALTDNTDGIRDLEAALSDAGGTAETMATQQLDTLSGSIALLKSALEGVSITLGKALAPYVRKFADWITATIPKVMDFASRLKDNLSPAIEGTRRIIQNIRKAFTALTGGIGASETAMVTITAVINTVAIVLETLSGLLVKIAPHIRNVASAIKEKLVWVFGILSTFVMTKVVPTIKLFASIIKENVLPALIKLGGFIKDTVLPKLKEIGSYIFSKLKAAFMIIGSFVVGTVLPALKKLGGYIKDTILPKLKEFGSYVAEKLGVAFGIASGFITSTLIPALKTIGKFIGETVIPALRKLGEYIKDTVLPKITELAKIIREKLGDAFGKIKDAIPKVIEKLNELYSYLSEKLTPVFTTIKRVAKEVFEKLVEWFGKLGEKLKPTFDAFNDIKESIKKIFKTIRDEFGKGEIAMGDFGGAGTALVKILDGVVIAINLFAKGLALTIKWIAEHPEVIRGVITVIKTFVKAIAIVIGAIILIVKKGTEKIKELWDDHGAAITKAVQFAWDAIKTVIDITLSAIQTSITVVLALIKGDWEGAWNAIKDHVATVAEAITKLWDKWGDDIKTLFEGIWEDLKTKVSNWAKDVVSLITTWASDVLGVITGWVTDTIDAFKGWVRDLIGASILTDWASDALKLFVNWAKDTLGEITGWVTDSIKVFTDWASDTLADLGDWISDFISDFGDWSSDVLSGLSEWSSDFASDFSTWASDNIVDLGNWASDFISDFGTWASDVITDLSIWASDMAERFSNWVDSIIGENGILTGWYNAVVALFGKLKNIKITWPEIPNPFAKVKGWYDTAMSYIGKIPGVGGVSGEVPEEAEAKEPRVATMTTLRKIGDVWHAAGTTASGGQWSGNARNLQLLFGTRPFATPIDWHATQSVWNTIPTDIQETLRGGLVSGIASAQGQVTESFAKGGFVPRDMQADIHRGEFIVPAREVEEFIKGKKINIVNNYNFGTVYGVDELQKLLDRRDRELVRKLGALV